MPATHMLGSTRQQDEEQEAIFYPNISSLSSSSPPSPGFNWEWESRSAARTLAMTGARVWTTGRATFKGGHVAPTIVEPPRCQRKIVRRGRCGGARNKSDASEELPLEELR